MCLSHQIKIDDDYYYICAVYFKISFYEKNNLLKVFKYGDNKKWRCYFQAY